MADPIQNNTSEVQLPSVIEAFRIDMQNDENSIVPAADRFVLADDANWICEYFSTSSSRVLKRYELNFGFKTRTILGETAQTAYPTFIRGENAWRAKYDPDVSDMSNSFMNVRGVPTETAPAEGESPAINSLLIEHTVKTRPSHTDVIPATYASDEKVTGYSLCLPASSEIASAE